MAAVLIWAVVDLVGLGQASDAILREHNRSIQTAGSLIWGPVSRQPACPSEAT